MSARADIDIPVDWEFLARYPCTSLKTVSEHAGLKLRDWSETIALWGKPPEGLSIIENTPAAVFSKDHERRVVYIGSDLETTSEDKARFICLK
ncbi:MAG: hypothetical protein HA496_09360 [Thaumarchaeota archaeon]|jgi:hypothetical protein|nr:hypothetical protein [Nitrososphaerota archaeon]